MEIRTMVGVGLLSFGMVGCTQPSSISASTLTVTVPTTVTEVKTVAEVQTQIVAPPAEVKTVSTVETKTVTPLPPATITETVTAAASGNGSLLTFNSAKVARDVRKLLTDAPPAGYGTTGVTDVSCPNDQAVKAGAMFLCHATINNSSKSVKITVQGNAGKYQVGLPD